MIIPDGLHVRVALVLSNRESYYFAKSYGAVPRHIAVLSGSPDKLGVVPRYFTWVDQGNSSPHV